MGDKGWGLVTTQPVEAGSLVIEYVGVYTCLYATSFAICFNRTCKSWDLACLFVQARSFLQSRLLSVVLHIITWRNSHIHTS